VNTEHEVVRGPWDEWSEMARVRAVEEHGVLDAPPEPAFDRLTALAARLLGAEAAFINFVGSQRQWTLSACEREWEIGGPQEVPREMSICARFMGVAAPIVEVPDTREDDRFRDHPAVQMPVWPALLRGRPVALAARLCAGHAVRGRPDAAPLERERQAETARTGERGRGRAGIAPCCATGRRKSRAAAGARASESARSVPSARPR
jgi:hypothetical protein